MQERLSRRLWVRQLLALVGKEFQQIVRDPSSYLVAGVLPLLFLLLFGYGITLDAGVLQLAVFNQSGGQHSRALLTDFAHSPHFVIRSISHMREGERLMRESSVQGILVLGQQFDAPLDRGTTAGEGACCIRRALRGGNDALLFHTEHGWRKYPCGTATGFL